MATKTSKAKTAAKPRKAKAKERLPYGTRSNVREERKQQTRRLLAAAATTLFEERGYTATTIDDIALQAGLGRATFYLHFASKLEVVREVRDHVVDRIKAIYRDLSHMESADPKTAEQWIKTFIGFYEDERKTVTLLSQTAAIEPELAREGLDIYQSFMDVIGEGIPAFHDAATGADRALRAEAFLFLFQLETLSRYLLLDVDPDDRAAMIEAAGAQLVRLLRHR